MVIMMSTRLLSFEKGRQKASIKLNVLRIRLIRTDGEYFDKLFNEE
jgi:hypothetical protein